MILTPNDVKTLITAIKNLKCDIFLLTHTGQVVGTDYDSVVLKFTNVDVYGMEYYHSCISDTFLQILKMFDPLSNTIEIFNNYHDGTTISLIDKDGVIINSSSCNMLESKNIYLKCKDIIGTVHSLPKAASVTRKSNTPEYETLYKISSSDGMILYNVDGYIFSIFSGLLPLNKADDLTIEIYEINSISFIVRFIIDKPKSYPIEIYVKYLKL